MTSPQSTSAPVPRSSADTTAARQIIANVLRPGIVGDYVGGPEMVALDIVNHLVGAGFAISTSTNEGSPLRKEAIAAGAIIDVMTGGKVDWRSRIDESEFLESADWQTALTYARAALSQPVSVAQKALDLRSALQILASLDRVAEDFRNVEPCRHNNDNLIGDLKIELAGLREALTGASSVPSTQRSGMDQIKRGMEEHQHAIVDPHDHSAPCGRQDDCPYPDCLVNGRCASLSATDPGGGK